MRLNLNCLTFQIHRNCKKKKITSRSEIFAKIEDIMALSIVVPFRRRNVLSFEFFVTGHWQIHCGWFLSCLQYWYCHSFNCLKDMLDVFSSTFWEMFHIASMIVLFYSFSTRKIYQQKNVKIVIWNKCMQLFHEWQRQIIGPLDYVILKWAFNHSVWTL